MKRILTLSIAALLVTATFAGFVGTVTAQEEDSPTLPAQFGNSTVDNSAAVIVLGEFGYDNSPTQASGSGYSDPETIAAHAIAKKHGYSVYHVPDPTNPNSIIPATQVIRQLSSHGNLSSVILVGGDQNLSNKVGKVFEDYGVSIRDQIYHDISDDCSWRCGQRKRKQILKRATLHQWESSDTLVVVDSRFDRGEMFLTAYANSHTPAYPVMSWEHNEDSIDSVATYLGADRIVVFGSIVHPPEPAERLEDRGYTVETRYQGVSTGSAMGGQGSYGKALDWANENATQLVIISRMSFNRLKNEFGVLGRWSGSKKTLTPVAWHTTQVASGNNTTFLVTKDADTLGSEARSKIEGMDNLDHVYLAYYDDHMGEDVLVDVSKATGNNTTVRSLKLQQDYYASRYRVGLLTYGYTHGLVVSQTQSNIDTIRMRNIGYDKVPVSDGTAVTMKFSGDVSGSNPDGEQQGDSYVVTYDEEVSSGDEFTVSVNGDDYGVYGHPDVFNYKIAVSGGLVNANQDINPIPGLGGSASILLGIVVLAVVVGGGYLAYRRDWHKGLVPEVSI